MAAENVIRLFARYSEGYRLAAEHGPTSGIVAEYAYRNTPRGHGPLGRFLDRRFLHFGAWESVRQRFGATKELVREEIQARRAAGRRTTILDLASGTACYLRELSGEEGGPDLDIFCRERDPKQVMHARELAAAEGVPVTFFVGDPTDESSYLCARDPDIIVASGVPPLIERNDVVRNLLHLAFKHVAPGGSFITTTVTSSQARLSPWEARIRAHAVARSAETLESWLRATGFTQVASRPYPGDGIALIGRKPSNL